MSADAAWRHGKKTICLLRPAPRYWRPAKPTEVDLGALQRSESEGILSQLVVQRAQLQQQQGELALELGDVKADTAVERAVTATSNWLRGCLGNWLCSQHKPPDKSGLPAAAAGHRDGPRTLSGGQGAVGRALAELEVVL